MGACVEIPSVAREPYPLTNALSVLLACSVASNYSCVYIHVVKEIPSFALGILKRERSARSLRFQLYLDLVAQHCYHCSGSYLAR